MDWLNEHAWAAWLGLAAVLGAAEMFSMDLILLMVAAGAVVGMAVALTDLPFAVQVLAASAAALAALFLVRPTVVMRLRQGPELQLGHGKLVGREAVVTRSISAHEHGRIQLAGEEWSAAPYDEFDTIEPGATVEVFEIRGATAYVHPLPQPRGD